MIDQKIRLRPKLPSPQVQMPPVYGPLDPVTINPFQYNMVSGLEPLAMLQQYRQSMQDSPPNQAQTVPTSQTSNLMPVMGGK